MATKQDEAVAQLERKGWRFLNWYSAHEPEFPDAQVAVMVKYQHRGSTHYCEVNPDGTVQS